MDRVFETLLLNQSGNTNNNNDGTTDTNNTNNNTLRQPNSSRYAQLIPNEMLQQQPPTDNKVSPLVEVVDVDTNDKSNNTTTADVTEEKVEENVRVYKMDKSTGQLELLPEDNYDVVYVDNNNNDSMDRVEDKEAAEADKVMDMAVETANAMDIDNDKDEEEEKASVNIQDSEEEEDLIYIVKTPSNNHHQQQGDIETSSSASSIDELNNNTNITNSTSQLTTTNSQAQINIASSTASNIARTLISRTINYNNLRPSYTMLLQNEQRDIEQQQQRQQRELQKKKDKAKLLSKGSATNTTGGKAGGEKGGEKKKEVITAITQESVLEKAQRLNEEQRSSKLAASLVKDAKVISDPDTDNTTTDNNTTTTPFIESTLLQAKLSSSLTSNTNIIDGDTSKVISQLTKLRKYQESNIQPIMTHLELDNWENDIDWLGYGSFDDDEDDEDKMDGVKKENEGKGKIKGNSKGEKSNAMDVDITKKEEVTTDDEGSCCPDFTSSHLQQPSFKPPVPFGGYAKRYKRHSTTNDNEDPLELLFEPRNPRLDALDLISAVNWEGVTSDTDDDQSIVEVPLILQSSIAGQSVATLLAPNPISRPLPFESHPNYQSRYERELSNDITSTADLSKPGGFGSIEALEKYKAMRQRKREQMAKDKQSRVTEVMSALSLTGTGRRITSSLMGPGGAERTGRPSRHALGSSSVHDAEYVEQLELVYNHSLVKPDLTMSEYRQFHRPRLPLKVVSTSCPWQFQARKVDNAENTKRVGGNKRAQLASADGSTIVGSYHAMMSAGANRGQSKIRTEADLSPSMGDLVIMEYVEERPPLFMTKGMTCRIVNYYRGDRSRCPISAGGGDRPLRKRHGDKAASANQGPTPSGPSNRAERPPRLIGPNQYKIKSQADLIGIIGTTKKKKSKEALALEAKKAKENAVDILPEGVTEILHQKVHGPFIGEVEENQTQTGLISNLFAAPMFRHNSEPTDFLMVCGQLKGKPRFSNPGDTSVSLGVVLRPLPKNIYCVGQTEPRVKVFSPNTNDEKKVRCCFGFLYYDDCYEP